MALENTRIELKAGIEEEAKDRYLLTDSIGNSAAEFNNVQAKLRKCYIEAVTPYAEQVEFLNERITELSKSVNLNAERVEELEVSITKIRAEVEERRDKAVRSKDAARGWSYDTANFVDAASIERECSKMLSIIDKHLNSKA